MSRLYAVFCVRVPPGLCELNSLSYLNELKPSHSLCLSLPRDTRTSEHRQPGGSASHMYYTHAYRKTLKSFMVARLRCRRLARHIANVALSPAAPLKLYDKLHGCCTHTENTCANTRMSVRPVLCSVNPERRTAALRAGWPDSKIVM